MPERTAPAPWDAGRLERALASCRLGRPLVVLEETGSTNDVVWERARDGAAEGLLVVAERQTRGRGRGGSAWFSPPGSGVWASFLLRPALDAHTVALLPLAAGLAAARAAERAGAAAALKWPNDLVTRDGARKLGGVLAESRLDERGRWTVVVGVGLNANPPAGGFPPELAPRASTLAAVAGRPIDRQELLAALAHCLAEEYAALGRGGTPELLARWKERAAIFGRTVAVRGGGAEVHGIARDLADDGALIVRLESGAELEVRAGQLEVAWSEGGALG